MCPQLLQTTATQTPISDDDAVAAEYLFCGLESWYLFGFYARRLVPPKAREFSLLSGAIVVRQVGCIARGVVGKPLIGVRDADLMQHAERVAGRLPLVFHNCR